ncbi:serine--tRNA ligase [Candidatus Woesearchaeota archaeon]|nr:serine--tRNA ligase [Candidatus Woesearchaeota archaeon]
MFNITLIREQPELVRTNLKKRKDPNLLKLLDEVIAKDALWRQEKYDLQKCIAERNQISKEIAQYKKQGKEKEAAQALAKMKNLPEEIQKREEEVVRIYEEVQTLLYRLPNLLHDTVPYGKDDTENLEVRKWGDIKKPSFTLHNHEELAEQIEGAEFERAVKIAGAGFYYLKNELALLNQALIRFAIDKLVEKKYTFIETPFMMRKTPYEGVTDLADFEKVMYKIEGEDAYLIATSEHPIAAMYMDETIPEEKLPLKFAGLSQCFRREIGSHGIDQKGLFRVHQFTKVEQFVFCTPEQSWELHEELLKNTEELWKELGIPYRIVNICTGDIGIVAAKKYDIEAWMPRQQKYREVVSCSHCTDYQARRLKIRCGKEGGEKRILHTLNCTAIATSRALVAILENFQNKDGSITIPKVLVPYMNGIKKIEKKEK